MSSILEYHMITEELPAPFHLINTMINAKGYVTNGGLRTHVHHFYHINYLLEGQMTIQFKQSAYKVYAGQAFFLPSEIPHALFTDLGYTQIGIDILPEEDEKGIYKMVDSVCQNRCLVTDPFSVITNYRELTALLENPIHSNILMAHNIAENTLLRALDHLNKNKRTAFSRSFEALLKDHDVCRLTLSDLCELLGYSRVHLERLAHREFGCGVIEYLNRMKLNRVCTLLVTTDLPIAQIAEETNFYDSGHLSVFFKKRTGITPGAYRRENRIHTVF